MGGFLDPCEAGVLVCGERTDRGDTLGETRAEGGVFRPVRGGLDLKLTLWLFKTL